MSIPHNVLKNYVSLNAFAVLGLIKCFTWNSIWVNKCKKTKFPFYKA